RYKGYVIRKNLAEKYGLDGTNGTPDPWGALFARAVADRQTSLTDLVPYWVFEGRWQIERCVPLFPLSRETARFEDLKRALALYPLVLGQPRQEELLRLLRERIEAAGSRGEFLRHQINLAPWL